MAYPSYYSPVTVQTGQVPSTQTDFPMLVSYTDNRLKSVANGGHVRNANGYDIRPYSNSTLATVLTFELESYNASTGQVVMWVKIPSLSDGYVIYLSYGEPSISTNGSSTGTWDANYKGVYHLSEGTGVNSADSTSNGNTAVPTTPVTTTGKIGKGLSFNGTDGQDLIGADLLTSSGLTMSAWITPTSANTLITNNGGNTTYSIESGNNMIVFSTSNARSAASSITFGTTYFVVATRSTGNLINHYINGTLSGTADQSSGTPPAGATQTSIGANVSGSSPIASMIDEVRISNSVRSTGWITTEYNNQNAPSTFAVLGTEVQSDVDFDASSNSSYQAAASSYNWNHTVGGSNRYLVVGVSMLSLAQTVSGITWNTSENLHVLGTKNSVSGAARIELWGLVAPSTGTHAIAVTLTGAIASASNASSYTGVNQSTSTEAFNSAQATNVGAADATVGITTVADNDWVVDTLATDDGSVTVGTGQTQTGNVTGAGGSGTMSWEAKGTAGVVTMSWTDVGALATWTIGGIALRPVSTSSGSVSTVFNGNKLFQLLGIGI